MGSKRRIAKYILPIILKDRKPDQWYVEPFVGGANMIDKVGGNRIGADNNKYLIALLKHCSEGKSKELSDYITEEEYNHIKNNKEKYSMVEVAHCGFNSSFGAKWFGGYTRARKNGWNRDVICGKNLLIKQMNNLAGVHFINTTYQKLDIPKNSIIYCDPPYQNTTKYKTGDFNHAEFWQWCREKTTEGHKVFISEYNAPDDFECIWEKQISNTLANKSHNKKPVEKLFKLRQ